jgi:hypothetical protein
MYIFTFTLKIFTFTLKKCYHNFYKTRYLLHDYDNKTVDITIIKSSIKSAYKL